MEVVQELISLRMGTQSTIVEVPEISCQESVEIVKSISQERSSERRCEQSEACLPDFSCHRRTGVGDALLSVEATSLASRCEKIET